MAKFYGDIGYTNTVETAPGVWEEVSTVRKYAGDVIKDTRRYESSDKLNDNLNLRNMISILADPYAYENIFALRFVRWMGASWKITNVEVQRPRVILTIGGVYNEQ